MRFIMKRTTKTILAAGLLATAGTLALTGASYADRGEFGPGECHGGPHGKKHHADHDRGPGGRHVEALIEEFDTNQDGKVTQAEIDAGREAIVAKFDANKDGTLSLDEYQALWLDAMHERMVDAFQRLDEDGDAIVTIDEFKAPLAKVVAHDDRNDDGALSSDDMKRKHTEHYRHDDDKEKVDKDHDSDG
jgi:Ca2+-binding EF-hand superfamily protein